MVFDTLLFKKIYLCHPWHFSDDGSWSRVLYKVEISQYYKDIRSRDMGKHPLINRQFAYWVDENTLCLGYSLKNNPSVFRPVFKPKRAKYMREIIPNIPIFVKKREDCMKNKANIILLQHPTLPVDIINCIMDFMPCFLIKID